MLLLPPIPFSSCVCLVNWSHQSFGKVMYLTTLKLREYLLTRLAVTLTQFFFSFLVLTSFHLLFVGEEALYHTQTHTHTHAR
jgi:hypothetical protein